MRWLIVALLVIPFSTAVLVGSAEQAGEQPVIYGDNIAYEREGSIYVYDRSKREEFHISEGHNPSLFGFTLVFETLIEDDNVIQYADLRNREVINTELIGHNPYVFSDFIVFSTKESELKIDFSNDGDEADDIIRRYDLRSDELENLKVVGNNPVINQRSLLFETEEGQVSVDLNADGDQNDKVIRVYDERARKAANTKIEGKNIALAKSNRAVFEHKNGLGVMDAVSHQLLDTISIGKNPTLFSDVVMFEHDGSIYSWSLDTDALAKTNVRGAQPSLFEETIAFITSEQEIGDINNNGENEFIVRFAKQEDEDGDDIPDFMDNCPAFAEETQDTDNDGIGDACEEKPLPPPSAPQQAPEPLPPSAQQMSVEVPREKSKWWIFFLILLFIPAGYLGYKYYKKKQKSFGF